LFHFCGSRHICVSIRQDDCIDTYRLPSVSILYRYGLYRPSPNNFQHLLTNKEKDEVGRELLKYSVDHNLGSVSEQSVVQWWAKVSERKCYPALCKIASAGLSIFHGPAVESSFNTLGDVVDNKAARMEISTYSAYQTVRNAMTARKTTAMQYFNRKDRNNNAVVDKHVCVNVRMAAQRYKKVQNEKREKKTEALKKLKSVKSVKEDMKKTVKKTMTIMLKWRQPRQENVL